MSAQDLEQRALEFLAAEYERDGKTGSAEHIRTQPLLPNKARAVRAIAAALRQRLAPADLEQFRGAVDELLQFAEHDDSCGDHDSYNSASIPSCGCGLDGARDRLLSIIDSAGKVECAEPVGESCADHEAGETGYCHFYKAVPWQAKLYLAPPQPAPVVDDARMARALEAARCGLAPEHVSAIEEAIAAYDPNCGARTVRVVDDALADTQRAIIEAAERRGYERAKAEAVVVDDAMVERYLTAVHKHLGGLPSEQWDRDREDGGATLRRIARIGLAAALARAQGVQS